MSSNTWNRRSFIRNSTFAVGSAAALGLSSRGAYGQDVTPTSEPVNVGEGGTEIRIWVQDHGASIAQYQSAAQRYIDAGNDVTVTVQPIAFADLLPKMLPSIAAGNEADIMMGYTNFYVGTGCRTPVPPPR